MSAKYMREAHEHWVAIDGDNKVLESKNLQSFVDRHGALTLMMAHYELSLIRVKAVVDDEPVNDEPVEGKQYSLLELSKTGKWSESEVVKEKEPEVLLEFF